MKNKLKKLIIKLRPVEWLIKRLLPYWVQLRLFIILFEPEVKILGKLIKKYGKGDTAIDIGANHGIFTYFLSKKCKYVQSFEPNPLPYKLLKFKTRKTKNIFTHNIGLSSSSGVMSMQIPLDSNGKQISTRGTLSMCDGSKNCEKIEVDVKTLDEFNFTDVTFIKIDVEGFENSVLDGAAATIQNNKPIIFIETESCSIINRIIELGYNCFYYDRIIKPLEDNRQIPVVNNKNVYNFIFINESQMSGIN